MTTTSATPMKAAVYHRVSTLDQDPTTARHELRAAAAARGLSITMEVEETGSGARNDRPGLQRVMEAARRNKIHAVIVWKLDRFGRSALDLLSNIRQLEDAGVRFIATSQGIEIGPHGDPMSRLLLTMLAAVSEFERSLIVERTRLGLEKARRAGKQLGRKRVVFDLERAVALRETGQSIREVAEAVGVGVGTLHRALQAAQERSGQAVEPSSRRQPSSRAPVATGGAGARRSAPPAS